MKKTKRLSASVAACVLAIVASLAPTGCGRDPGDDRGEVSRPAKIFTVRASGGDTPRVFPGQVQAARRVPLSFRVGGPVVELAVSKGQHVAEGEFLARVDPRDYEVQVRNLEAQLASARAQHKQSVDEYRRIRGLYQHDNASKSEFDRARAAVDVGQAQVEATEQALRAARLALSDTDLTAPFDGVVADRLVDAHQVISAGQPVLLFQDMHGVEVVIDVPEREVAELTRKEPRKILVRFDALPRQEFPAQVKEFATEADSGTQTFPVTLRLDRAPSTDLLSGMTAAVSWFTANGDRDAAMVVPLASVIADEGGDTHVWLLGSDSRVSRVDVVTGSVTDDGIEILSGLTAGDRILAAGVHYVNEGQLVRPLEG
jgi:RND family efflux transporter MFP subunit